MEWTEAGVAGAYRFTQRLFRLVERHRGIAGRRGRGRRSSEAAALALRQAAHQTIQHVTEALESFGFNLAVARIYEFANAMAEAERAPGRTGVGLDCGAAGGGRHSGPAGRADDAASGRGDAALLRPGEDVLIAEQAWPEADPALAAVRAGDHCHADDGQAARHAGDGARGSRRRRCLRLPRRSRTWRGCSRASAW